MKPTDSIDLGMTREVQGFRTRGTFVKDILDKDLNVASAEQEVQRSISRFENAMENLAHRAEVTHDKIQYQVQQTQAMIHLPRQKLQQWDNQFAHWARVKSYAIEDGLVDISNKIETTAQQVSSTVQESARATILEVRSNPRPYLWAAGIAGLFAGLLIFTGFGEDSPDDEI